MPGYNGDDSGNFGDNGHNDDSEEKSSYRLIYDYQDTTGNGAMLPNSQMTATTYLEDKTKDYQRVDDYKLEILEQSKLADISVSADGKNLLLNLAIKPVRAAVTYLYRYRMEKADTEKPSEKICGSASVSM